MSELPSWYVAQPPCFVCGAAYARYRCGRCGIRTCSSACLHDIPAHLGYCEDVADNHAEVVTTGCRSTPTVVSEPQSASFVGVKRARKQTREEEKEEEEEEEPADPQELFRFSIRLLCKIAIDEPLKPYVQTMFPDPMDMFAMATALYGRSVSVYPAAIVKSCRAMYGSERASLHPNFIPKLYGRACIPLAMLLLNIRTREDPPVSEKLTWEETKEAARWAARYGSVEGIAWLVHGYPAIRLELEDVYPPTARGSRWWEKTLKGMIWPVHGYPAERPELEKTLNRELIDLASDNLRLKFMLHHVNNGWVEMRYAVAKLIVNAVRSGRNRADVLRELRSEQWNATAEDARIHNNEALRSTSINGDLESARELLSWGLTAEDARANTCEALRNAARGGHLEFVVMLRSLGFTARDARTSNAVLAAADRGHWTVLRELRTWDDPELDEPGLLLRHLTAEDARKDENAASRAAAVGCHAEVLRELFSWDDPELGPRGRLTADDARTNNNEALNGAVMLDCPAVVRELRVSGHLTADDARNLIHMTAIDGRLGVLRELMAFGLTVEDIRMYDNVTLHYATSHGHADYVRELRSCGLTVDDARSRNNEAIRRAAKKGHWEVLRELRSWVDPGPPPDRLTADDARTDNNAALRAAADGSHVEALRELKLFGLTPEDARANHKQALRSAIARNDTRVLDALIELWGVSRHEFIEPEPEEGE